MIFEWDPTKARSNLRKHGVSFEEATSAFNDPLSRTFDDPDHSIDEQRFIIIGHSYKNRLIFVSHTDDQKIVRLISAREVTASERKYHEER
jgi:uncharacterized protein